MTQVETKFMEMVPYRLKKIESQLKTMNKLMAFKMKIECVSEGAKSKIDEIMKGTDK